MSQFLFLVSTVAASVIGAGIAFILANIPISAITARRDIARYGHIMYTPGDHGRLIILTWPIVVGYRLGEWTLRTKTPAQTTEVPADPDPHAPHARIHSGQRVAIEGAYGSTLATLACDGIEGNYGTWDVRLADGSKGRIEGRLYRAEP